MSHNYTSQQQNRVHTLSTGELKTLTPSENEVYKILQEMFPGSSHIMRREISTTIRRNNVEFNFRSKGFETPTGIVVEIVKSNASPEDIQKVEDIYKSHGLTYVPIARNVENIGEVIRQKLRDIQQTQNLCTCGSRKSSHRFSLDLSPDAEF